MYNNLSGHLVPNGRGKEKALNLTLLPVLVAFTVSIERVVTLDLSSGRVEEQAKAPAKASYHVDHIWLLHNACTT
jgi:hypothetical protein